ncbi:MAG: glycogen-binding domain-containing protein [Balneolales bacterium]
MIKRISCIIGLIILPITGVCQQWQGLISVDTRAGYSTNTILNPFSGEWDRSSSSGYGFISPMGQLYWSREKYSADITGGGVYQPFFDGRDELMGGFSLLNFRRRFGSSWSAGMETGSSYFSRPFVRGMAWFQPVIAWSPTLFSQIRVRAGSTYRDYESLQEGVSGSDRFDTYGIEFEVWPTFKWQLRAGMYGNMDQLADNQSFMINAEHRFTDALQVSARLNADRHSYQLIQDIEGSGSPGPPIGGPGSGDGTDTEMLDETDRLVKAGLSGRYRMNQSFALTMNMDHIVLYSSASEQTLYDYQLSAGVRYTVQPKLGGRGKAEPEWKQNGQQILSLKINYSGEGQLYIIGDFNDWDNPGMPLTRQSSNRYAAQLSLPTGAYEYKILLIDGPEEKWIDFSNDTYTVSDGFGGTNGLVFIE